MSLTIESAVQALVGAKQKIASLRQYFNDEAKPYVDAVSKLQGWLWEHGEHTAESLVEEYVAMRDERSALKAAYEAEDDKIKDRMEQHEVKLMEMLTSVGAESFRTPYGTAYTQTDIRSNCADWTAYWAYIQETGRFDLLEKRVSQKPIKDMIEAGEALPPGINTFRERKVVIRRS